MDYANSSKTVLLVFQPRCPACSKTVPYWREIVKASKRDNFQVLGISLGDRLESEAFLRSGGLNLETYTDIAQETKRVFMLNLTPITIVINKAGKVERIWPGAFSQETKPEVEEYFDISVLSDVS